MGGIYHNRPQVQKLLQLARAEGIKQYEKKKKKLSRRSEEHQL
jgi:hypothetical protein